MATLDFALVNNTGSDTVYAYITGQAIDNNNAVFLLQADGKTAYYPTSPSATGSALAQDSGGRLWFSRDAKLTFLLNPGPALVEPSSSNPSDPNYNIFWDFAEFTWNSSQLFVNISMVDFFSLPIALALENTSGSTNTVKGLPADGLETVCNGLTAQDAKDNAGWSKLIVKQGGANLRAVSPNTGAALTSGLLANYFDGYVRQVWSKYGSDTLTVDTQAAAGKLTAKVQGNNLTFSSGGITYAPPSSADIFANSSGVFAVSSDDTKNQVSARLAAAFNRSTLLTNANQPDGEVPSNYYTNPVTNHYARICHATALDGRGYAFPYDDVGPSNGADQSGSVYDPNPKLLTVTVGGLTSNSTKKDAKQGDTPRSGGDNGGPSAAPTQPSQGGNRNPDTQKQSRSQTLTTILHKLLCHKSS
ncbi:CAZyme family GH64 [Penicillium chermesinum]|nr:CAZyme family GH64 [Penicillium chermesinum]